MTGFVLLWGWVPLRVHVFDRSLGVALPVGARILGVIFMGLGGILALTCAGVFVARGRGTPSAFRRSEKFRRRRSLSVRSESDVHSGRSLCWSVLVCTSILSQSCSCV